MSEVLEAKTLVLRRLHGALSQPLPPKAVTRGNALLDRLNASVRIGLFGLPGAGKRAVLNALAGEAVIAPGLDLPTLELVHGAPARTHMMLPDGSSLSAAGYPGPDIKEVAPVYLQIQTPSAQISGCNVLLVATDATPDDMTAALAWAATRVDLSVWCTRAWTSLEQQIWESAPDALRNHAVLILTGDGNARTPDFEKVLGRKDGATVEARITQLAFHIKGIIEEATAQDLMAADAFLQKFAPNPTANSTDERALGEPQPTAHPDPDPTPPHPETIKTATAPLDDEAARHLTRLFQVIRDRASALRQQLDATSPEAAFAQIEDIFTELADRLDDSDALELAAPDLCETIEDARDTALLMRVESQPDQLATAAMLLLQVRQEIETQLAA